MVAYTSPDCLPFLEATDSFCVNTGTVCEPSTVWCDQAEILEARLDSLDAVVARTATSTPIGWMETTVAARRTVGDPELQPTFDAVRVDTDNMVDLALNASGFQVNTAGLYQVVAYAIGTANVQPGNSIVSGVIVRQAPPLLTYGADTLFSAQSEMQTVITGQILTPAVHVVLPFQAGQAANIALYGGGVTGDFMTYSKISFLLAWMGDLP